MLTFVVDDIPDYPNVLHFKFYIFGLSETWHTSDNAHLFQSMIMIIYLTVVKIQSVVVYHCLSIKGLIIYLRMISTNQCIILLNHNILNLQIAIVLPKIW